MGMLINLYASATGLWKKVAAMLPFFAGVGTVFVGAGSILIQVSHSKDAASALKIVTSLSPTDPNVAMILAGLTALGIHTNHAQTQAAVADHAAQLNAMSTPVSPAPAAQPPQQSGS